MLEPCVVALIACHCSSVAASHTTETHRTYFAETSPNATVFSLIFQCLSHLSACTGANPLLPASELDSLVGRTVGWIERHRGGLCDVRDCRRVGEARVYGGVCARVCAAPVGGRLCMFACLTMSSLWFPCHPPLHPSITHSLLASCSPSPRRHLRKAPWRRQAACCGHRAHTL